jgi:sarcosine oxidase subunit gamma
MDALFDLRGEPSAIADVAAIVGLSLPEHRNSMTSNDEASVFWIGPERWLLRAPLAREDALADAFAAAVGDRFAHTLPVSDMYVRIEVSGPEARDVLAQGCSINLHPEHFAVGAATSTEIFGVSMILCHEDESPSFTAYVDRSYVDFVIGRLRRGAFPSAT